MTEANRQEPTETVIVLGAGASAADGGSVQSELFRDYFRGLRNGHGDGNTNTWDRELATFFQQFFGIDVQSGDLDSTLLPTFEEILGILEIAEAESESFQGFGTSHLIDQHAQPRVQHLQRLLVILIAETLERKLRHSSEHHEALIAGLQRLEWLSKTTFVSLNYDILIDNALERACAVGGWNAPRNMIQVL